MANGKTHDRINLSILIIALPFIYLNYIRDIVLLAIFGLSYIFGTLYMSPDLDMEKTKPYHRWGRLSFIWYPYSKLVPHRSTLSHSFLIGTLFRLLWFLASLFLLGFLAVWIIHMASLGDGFKAYMDSWNEIKFFFLHNKPILYALLIGLFLSSLLHEIVDIIWTFFKIK